MVTLSKKVLAVLMVIPVVAVLIGIAAWQNWGGIGTALSGLGGPVGAGLLSGFSAPLQWALSGGGATLAMFWGLIFAVGFGFAYWVWHWDIGYKLQGTTAQNIPLGTHSTQREPEEPERAPQTPAVTVEKGS